MTKTTETFTFYTDKDDYGRTVYSTHSRTGVVVVLPKFCTPRYLVNLRLKDGSHPVTHVRYFGTLAEGKASVIADSDPR